MGGPQAAAVKSPRESLHGEQGYAGRRRREIGWFKTEMTTRSRPRSAETVAAAGLVSRSASMGIGLRLVLRRFRLIYPILLLGVLHFQCQSGDDEFLFNE